MTDKADLRRTVLARRRAAHAAGNSVTDHLLSAVTQAGIPAGGPVAGYLPIRSEVDPLAAMAEISGTRPVAVPVVIAAGEPLRFRHWRPRVALAEGPYGTRHPEAGEWVEPMAVIVPIVAFDRRGYRLGYGGGFYDRTLEQLRLRGAITAIGLAYAAQEVDEVPLEPTDQPLDLIVTEQGVILPVR